MLSSEGSNLARLMLARHTLVCRAIELETKYVLLTHTDVGIRNNDGNTRAHNVSPLCRVRMQAELVLVPALVDHLDEQIERARLRLDTVSPPPSSRSQRSIRGAGGLSSVTMHYSVTRPALRIAQLLGWPHVRRTGHALSFRCNIVSNLQIVKDELA